VRVGRLAVLVLLTLFGASEVRAEYIVLRSGQRLSVTGYQLVGDKYELQVVGGSLELPATEVVSIEPEEVFTPLPPAPVAATAQGPFAELIQAAAKRYGVDVDLIASVIAAESNFNPKAISPRNARGLMQLLPVTAERLGVRDIFDPSQNIDAGTRYLSDLLKQYKNDLALALAAYNAGPESVQRYGAVPPYRETVSYVKRVRNTYQTRKSHPNQRPDAATPSQNTPANAATGAPVASVTGTR
jgi:soluble lytic murein transglycosylase-like protein